MRMLAYPGIEQPHKAETARHRNGFCPALVRTGRISDAASIREEIRVSTAIQIKDSRFQTNRARSLRVMTDHASYVQWCKGRPARHAQPHSGGSTITSGTSAARVRSRPAPKV